MVSKTARRLHHGATSSVDVLRSGLVDMRPGDIVRPLNHEGYEWSLWTSGHISQATTGRCGQLGVTEVCIIIGVFAPQRGSEVASCIVLSSMNQLGWISTEFMEGC